MSLLCLLVRPFGVAVGILVLVNLVLALQDPTLATTEIWLNLHLDEPLQALVASLLGVALLMHPSDALFLFVSARTSPVRLH